MRINHNIPALYAQNALAVTDAALQKTIRRLSTGLRINSAADDAAGLALSEKMESQIRGLQRAARNAQDGISLIQTAEGALSEVHSILHRMRELSVQAANETLTAGDRQFIQLEIDALKKEIDRIASTTQFNKKRLLDGSFNFLGSSSDQFVRLLQSGAAPPLSGETVSGNYRISVSAQAGKAEILKSGILYATSGTRSLANGVSYTDQDKTQIRNVGAVNLAAGVYSLETREVPFGGTIFLENGVTITKSPSETHGVESLVAPGINAAEEKVPYGEYYFRATDTVPFMATYDLNADGSGAVASVSPPTGDYFRTQNSTSAPSNGTYGDRAVNASMEFNEKAAGTTTRYDTLLWNNADSSNIDNSDYASSYVDQGTAGSLLIPRNGYEYNMFTTFDVIVYDRWRLASNIGNISTTTYQDTANNTEYYLYASAAVTITIDGVSFDAGDDIETIQYKLQQGGVSTTWVTDPNFDASDPKTSGQFTYNPTTITVSVAVGVPSIYCYGLDSSRPYTAPDAATRDNYINLRYNDLLNNISNTVEYYVNNYGFLGSGARLSVQSYTSSGGMAGNAGTMTYTINNDSKVNFTSDERMARDRIYVLASYQGVDSNTGQIVEGSASATAYVGFAKGAEFSDLRMAYASVNFDSLMEQGDDSGNPPYDNGRDKNPPVNSKIASWSSSGVGIYTFDFATYTSPALSTAADVITAQTAIQNSNRVGRNTNIEGDDDYAWPKIDYVFKDGVLDGKDVTLPQLYRGNYGYTYTYSDGSTYTYNAGPSRYSLYHNFTINGGFQTSANALAYGFRRSSDPVPEDGYTVDPKEDFKAKAFYGTNTTSYFDKAGNPDDYFKTIAVWAQENSNAALAFRYRGLDANGFHVFDVGVKGYEANGDEFDYEVKGATVDTAAPKLWLDDGSGGDGSIHFDNFEMNWAELTVGDAFIVNVSAAAFFVNQDTDAAATGFVALDKTNLTDFSWGTDTVTTSGQPQGNAQMGAASEYRFIDGANEGKKIELLSYFVDPIDGADEELGIQKQGFEMTFSFGGLQPSQGTKSEMQDRTTADVYAYAGPPDKNIGRTIFAEVNYVGSSDPKAAAVVGSYFFRDLQKTHDQAVGVTDFIRKVEYNEKAEWNGSLLFDVVDIAQGHGIRFRVQGHLYDGDGNYRYAEDHDLWLYPGENNNLLLFAGDRYEGLNSAPEFAGLLFDTIELAGDTHRFSVGDRFTLSLAADARVTDPSGSDWDELNLTSDGLGTGYPMTWRFREGVLDNAGTELRLFQVDSRPQTPNGTDVRSNAVMDGVFYLAADDFHNGATTGEMATGSDTPRTVKRAAEFAVGEARGFDARLAHYYTKLKDIGNFYDASGNFLLSVPQQLEIRQGNESVFVTIHGEMEVKDLVEALAGAIYRMGGQYLMEKFPGGMMFLSGNVVGKDHSEGFHDETHLAEWFNWERRESAYETVPGTFVVRSYKTGADGEYRFLADDGLLNALAFVTIQNSEENVYNVTARDAHDETIVASATIRSGETVDELLPGDAALKFDSASGVRRIVYNEETGRYDFEMESAYDVFVHIAANDMMLQTGANEGETLHMRLRSASSSSLGLDRLYVTDAARAKRTITILDSAIGRVSSMRAALGACQNRLEHTIGSLSVTQTNMTSSKSRIADADYAQEMMNFTRLSILSQSGMAFMAQARALPQNILSLTGP
ncbi:MAG: hypothetical protein LBO82_10265 [Synergistaceae bacterium]|jgi:flagellin-like hook-associated protein FlgL|nr:hypothetical protein [Synergistaceae bacterium]